MSLTFLGSNEAVLSRQMLNVVNDSRVWQQSSVLVDTQQSISKRAFYCRVFSVIEQAAFIDHRTPRHALIISQRNLTL